ncbi:hypothetical protein GS592_26015 [Rhodococcus hoagii]|nr:hypothetical protein [Prescottella equi]
MDAIRMEARSPEDFVQRCGENAKRAIDTLRYSTQVSQSEAQERISSLLANSDDENGTLAKRILLTGNPVYERAFGKALKHCNRTRSPRKRLASSPW